MKIGLALSGGGFRATVFHLGVLARLSAEQLMNRVRFLSIVSGGSLLIGLVFAASDYKWPQDEELANTTIPHIRKLLTNIDLQRSFIRKVVTAPLSIFRSRANDFSRLMQKLWGIEANLQELPQDPRWIINATCYETGKDWRFERKRMGDYVFGYVMKPKMAIADAMAASSAYPGLIGPFVINAKSWEWNRYKASESSISEIIPASPPFAKAHLWDGAVYDNLGTEPLFKTHGGYRQGIDILIVSDASARTPSRRYKLGPKVPLRLVSIAMDQVRGLRARTIVSGFIRKDYVGSYLRIGNSGPYILNQVGRSQEISNLCANCLPDDEAQSAASLETTIRKLTENEFDTLLQHGFEVADFTLSAYLPEKFTFIGYRHQQ